MAHAQTLVKCGPSGETETWKPVTLESLNKSEEYFEKVLANCPELLDLETRRSGVRGPMRAFRQLSLLTPSGNKIYPDITFLTASGHVVVVEVKRYGNAELRNRSVIAQIIDYASSFADLSDEQLLAMFTDETGTFDSWGEFITSLFPRERNIEELSDVLRARLARGELNLVVACDKVPIGLPEIVAGVSSQKALGFELDLMEAVPFVRQVSDDAEIIFVPNSRLETQIVARTAVNVIYTPGAPKPQVSVQTTPTEEIEKSLMGGALPRTWTLGQTEEAVRADGNPIEILLLNFCKEHSHLGNFIGPGKRKNANFGFYLQVQRPDGTPTKLLVFSCTHGWNAAYVYMDKVRLAVASEIYLEFQRRLAQLFGEDTDTELKEAWIGYENLTEKLEGFLNVMLWLKSQVASDQ